LRYSSDVNTVLVFAENRSARSLLTDAQIILADGIRVKIHAGKRREQIVDFVAPGGMLIIKSCIRASF
jgi:UDP-N-acetyl-D-mannosaminuronic acid transferase (WecB/TagA/CpsF family)